MNSSSDACCNEVANFFVLRLPEDIYLEVRFWCGNKFPAWQVAILISWMLQEGSGRKSYKDKECQQEIETAVSRAKNKTSLSANLIRRTIENLFPAEVELSRWAVFLDKILLKDRSASVELIAYVFAIFANGGIKDEHQLNSAIAAFYAPVTLVSRPPGS